VKDLGCRKNFKILGTIMIVFPAIVLLLIVGERFGVRSDIIPSLFFILTTCVYPVRCPAWMTVIREAHTNKAQPLHSITAPGLILKKFASTRETC